LIFVWGVLNALVVAKYLLLILIQSTACRRVEIWAILIQTWWCDRKRL